MLLAWSRLTSYLASRLYVRIWLAVVATVVVLTFLVGASWRLTQEPSQLPIREVLVHNTAGEVIGTAQTRAGRKMGDGLEFDVTTTDGQTLKLLLPRPRLQSPGAWSRPPFNFGWMLVIVALAVALGAYPVIRRLTLRLEALQRGVERWGAGDLSARVNSDGHDEVAFLAADFNNAAERIEMLMNSHKALLANASHELRSPLARIRMSLELMDGVPALAASHAALPPAGADLARGGPPLRSPEAQSSLSAAKNEIKRSIRELDQLIDEILLASRLDAKQPDAEPFEALDLTGLAAEECARVHAELNAEFATRPDLDATGHSLVVQGSPRLLRRLIRNLLENARRYSTGEISLELSQSGTGRQAMAVITVNDRGPGVPLAQRERIFEKFYRLPGASEREGGVGLGLALVRSICERHGGSVRCDARAGGGASFVVTLPMAGAAHLA